MQNLIHEFELPVTWRDEEILFKARLLKMGYVYKMEVEINGQAVLFEPDEEGNWRAMADATLFDKSPDPSLLHAMSESIQFLTR
ncbi:MAG TPA: hypothetical protein VNR87_04015 [Flavisolibacter sp.]|nr:hypothetical protein [Flavisolibacter sp.]